MFTHAPPVSSRDLLHLEYFRALVGPMLIFDNSYRTSAPSLLNGRRLTISYSICNFAPVAAFLFSFSIHLPSAERILRVCLDSCVNAPGRATRRDL